MVIELAYRLENNVEVVPSKEHSLLPELSSRVVLDGYFRINTDFTAVDSLYWNSEKLPIRRGTWFSAEPEQIPLPSEQADEIDRKYAQVSGKKC